MDSFAEYVNLCGNIVVVSITKDPDPVMLRKDLKAQSISEFEVLRVENKLCLINFADIDSCMFFICFIPDF